MNEKEKSPRRTCQEEGLRKLILLARQTRKADAVLVLCVADNDCPATWGPDAERVVSSLSRGGAVMALREYETWLLLNYTDEQLAGVGVPVPEHHEPALMQQE